jgi:hypothetical protein
MSARIAAAAPGPIRRPVKRLFRAFGFATSGLRPYPDYLIIGAHRAGTTSLAAFLNQHPCIAENFPRLQRVKGVRYFDENFYRSLAWYRSHFPTQVHRDYRRRRYGAPCMAGDASPYYLFHPAAAARAARVVPEAKLIVLLRNPIDRAYSHWNRERRDGTEPLERFEDAIAAEPARLEGEVERILSDQRYYSYAHENFSYISQGLYVEPLRKWLQYYPREQVHVEITERLSSDPQDVYERVLRFLGLPPVGLGDAARRNTIPPSQPLGSATRRELVGLIAPHNRRLQDYLGIDLGWDTPVGHAQRPRPSSAIGVTHGAG